MPSLLVTLTRGQLLRLMETAPRLRTVLEQEIVQRLAQFQAQTEDIFPPAEA